ncbi:MAG: ABC transporter substrate-binding protein [Bacteroidales bacterium]
MKSIRQIIKDLWLTTMLILLASAILLLSDLEQRKSARKRGEREFPKIAIMQISSTPLLDNHVAGILDRLESEGYIASDQGNIRMFNPQGDMNTANAIAKEIANGPYELVITSSTVALQTFSKANQNSRKIHVFGAVTDPYGAGVGISGPDPTQHLPYMVGIGSFQPVTQSFRILHELNPKIKRVGVVWNPGEQCSLACVTEARRVCKELGIQLIEAIAANTTEVSEAVRSLMAKGVEAVYIGGDTVANSSINLIIKVARDNDVPVFTNDPSDVKIGALFGLGANYFTVGQYTADLAIAILRGKSPSEFGIDNVVPEELQLNQGVLQSLGTNWNLSEKVLKMLREQGTAISEERVVLDFAELKRKGIRPTVQMIKEANWYVNIPRKDGKPARIAMITLVENKLLEEAEEGFSQGLTGSGLKQGRDFTIRKYSAQGEIGQLPQVIDAAVREKPDLIVTVTTPALMAIVKKVRDIPVVFSVASDPNTLKIFPGGRPDNICGVHDNPDVEALLEMAMNYDRGLKAVGVIFDAAQMNSVISVEKLRKVCRQKRVILYEATASTVTDLGPATQAVIQKGAGAIIISADNLAITGFSAIHKAASASNTPIFASEPRLVAEGATGAYGDAYAEWGKQSGKMAAKILAGVPPAQLPIAETEIKQKIEPKSTMGRTGLTKRHKLRIVHYSDTEFAERCHEGLVDGFTKAGLREGKDYELKTYNAQGDMTTLSSIMTTIKADRVDLLMVISTPALQAALRQAGPETKIVFTGVGDGVKAGAGKSETDHLPNVTGITTKSPFDEMAKLIKESVPDVRQVGTLFTPAEINSVLYKNWFAEALKKQHIELVALPVTSSADIVQAATELCRQNIQVVCQVVDNMTRPGFALIARKAAENDLPVFVFDSDQMNDGGVICVSRDYYDAGVEAAEKAVRVLQGESPAKIPFSNTRSVKLLYDPIMAAKYKLKLSDTFLAKAKPISNQK